MRDLFHFGPAPALHKTANVLDKLPKSVQHDDSMALLVEDGRDAAGGRMMPYTAFGSDYIKELF